MRYSDIKKAFIELFFFLILTVFYLWCLVTTVDQYPKWFFSLGCGIAGFLVVQIFFNIYHIFLLWKNHKGETLTVHLNFRTSVIIFLAKIIFMSILALGNYVVIMYAIENTRHQDNDMVVYLASINAFFLLGFNWYAIRRVNRFLNDVHIKATYR